MLVKTSKGFDIWVVCQGSNYSVEMDLRSLLWAYGDKKLPFSSQATLEGAQKTDGLSIVKQMKEMETSMSYLRFSQSVVLVTLITLPILSAMGCTVVSDLIATPTPTPTHTPTITRLPTSTPTFTPTITWTPTRTPRSTSTPRPTSTRMPSATRTNTSTRAPIPSGPAKIVASLPEIIPCTPWGSDGCIWNYKVAFTEANGVPATIERIGRRFNDTKGKIWTVGSSEWSDTTIVIPGRGSNTYSSWVRTRSGSDPDLRNGAVKVSFSGHDANGHPFSGSVSAHLASSEP